MQIFFGGTFDPIHIGHIRLGVYISNLFKQPISLMPTSGTPNYKQKPVATIEERITMLSMIVKKYPHNFNIEYTEAKLTDYSPTINTLRTITKQNNQIKASGFIIGGDSFLSLNSCWDEWQELFKYTNFIVVTRPNYEISNMNNELQVFCKDRFITNIADFDTSINGQILLTEFTPVDISSTQIRQAIKQHRNIKEYLDNDIYSYIIENQIYT